MLSRNFLRCHIGITSAFNSRFRSLLLLCVGCLIYTQSFGAVFTVTNTSDSNPFSFRNCIVLSNFSLGTDTIAFAVSGTVTLLSPLPPISDRVFIDGTTAPGYVACGNPQFVLNGAAAGSANGLQLLAGASGSTIQALNIRSFALNGLQLIDSDANTIRSCYIGTTQNGNAAFPNGLNGIQFENTSDFNTIGGSGPCDGNVISGNGGVGISLNSSNSNSIVGNHVGVNAAGTGAVGNSSIGILLVNGSNSNLIGGATLDERNIISNNGSGLTGNGLAIDGSTGNIIRNNYIGVDVTGSVAMGNAENGISLNVAPNSIIGGSGALEGNVISNHNFHAIVLNGASNNVDIQGNVIGTNAAGTVAMGNDDSGVIVINSSSVNIGGTAPGAGNLLSGSISEYGVFVISSSDVLIQGNQIGTDINGTAPIPNFDGGIRIDFNSNDNTVGGTAAGAGNTIAFNTGYGVGVLSNNCARNLISRNSFFCNTGLGIDLNGVGNNNHPSPTITAFSTGGASGNAQPNDMIELYYDSVCTASCQGKDYIATVSANAAGVWSYAGPLTGSATLVAVAIRTSLPATLVNNTSEATCQTILPVEWASFKATLDQNNVVQLDWETTSELNASHFEVERSYQGGDFEKIGEVEAANHERGSSYQFSDHAPLEGLNSYRLKQVDLNGEFTHSEVRQILFSASGVQLMIGSNPADEMIRFRVSGIEDPVIRCELLDQVGKVVFTQGYSTLSQDWNSIPVENLAGGMYHLRIATPTHRIIRCVLIQH